MNTKISEWQIAYASVRGKSHIDAGLPNQDALHLAVSPDQTCFALALSDGAGSARFAEEGARHFARFIGNRLLALVHDANEHRFDGASRNQIGDQILHIIAAARQELDPRGTQLRDYAANLMAIAMGPHWGIRVHLGDAVLLKSRFATQTDQTVDYFAECQTTAQDRSEYANETHFLTQHDWTRHLVWDFLDPSGPEDMYALMTDGAGELALSNIAHSTERRIFRGFFAPLVAQILRAAPGSLNQTIHDALASPASYRITGDDKTLALVIRSRCWAHKEAPPARLDPVSPAVQATPAEAPAPAPQLAMPPSRSDATTPLPHEEHVTGGQPPHDLPTTSLKARALRAYWSAMGLVAGLLIGLAAWPTYDAVSAHLNAPPVSAKAPVARTPLPAQEPTVKVETAPLADKKEGG